MLESARARLRATTSLAAVTVLATTATVLAPEGSAGAAESVVSAATKPDIVLVLLDDARLDDLSAAPDVVRRIGGRGVTLTNFYASFPLCCPARATLLTGEYPHNHGVLGNKAPTGGFAEFDDSSTLATWLTDEYRTALVGKYFNEYRPPYQPPGWDVWMAPRHTYDYTSPAWWIARGTTAEDVSKPGYQTDTMGDLASQFITANAGRAEPYFLYTSIVAPHAGLPADPDDPAGIPTPYVKPMYRDAQAGARLDDPAFNEADTSDKPWDPAPLTPAEIAGLNEANAQRREAVMSAEDAVNKILDALEAAGTLDETYVLFMSDNGYILGEHRLRGGKVAPYEVSNHVPFMVSGPGIPRGAALDAVTAQVDFAPTVMAMAGKPVPPSVDGINLLPSLKAPGSAAPARRGVLLEATDTKATTDPLPWAYRGVVTPGWKYVERETGARELYNLTTDPSELRNLAGQVPQADRQLRMATLLERYRDCRGVGCR